MDRPGLMAPPDLYEHPARPGLMSAQAPAHEMSPSAHPPPHEISLSGVLWLVAATLGVVELLLESALL